MKTKCAWCQQEFEEITPFTLEEESVEYICPSCLIPLLPKTLSLKEGEETEHGNDTIEERRRFQRFPLFSQVYLSAPEKTDEITKILILDISNMGMRIQVETSLDPGNTITIGVLNDYMVYKSIGTVTHIKEVQSNENIVYEIGMRLTAIHQEIRN
jgi:hypothetical protein